MRKEDIIAGGIYADGKLGLRRVLRLDVPPSDLKYGGGQSEDKDFLEYEVIHAKRSPSADRSDESTFCTRASLATWAKAMVPEDQVEATRNELIAKSVKLTPSGVALLYRLHQDQAGKPHAQMLTAREARTAQNLKFQELLFVIQAKTSSARLAPAGEAWIRQHPRPESDVKPPSSPEVEKESSARRLRR